MSRIWGVDSAARVNPAFYQCVVQNFGKPAFWGRYLSTVPNVSDGLTLEEVQFLRENGVKIWPIYNQEKNAIGYRGGQVSARNAIYHAQRLKLPKGTMLFANLEHQIDEDWIKAWTNTLYLSGYRPGLYGDPTKGDLTKSYCEAVAQEPNVQQHVIFWSNQPRPGVTKKKDAPKYNPAKPNCTVRVWGWQYGWDDPACTIPIDTNLIEPALLPYLA